MPSRQNYSKDQVLTNYSIAYTNPDTSFIADSVFPRLGVNRENGTYFVWDKGNMRPEHDVRAAGAPSNEVDYEMTEASFGPLVQHSLKHKVTDENVAQAENALAPFRAATRILTEKLRVGKEIDAAAQLAAASNGITVSSSTDRWDDYDSSDPIGMLQDAVAEAKKASFRAPNTLILGEETVQPLLNHPDVLARLGDSQTRITRLPIIADLIGVRQVLVGDAQKNTAAEGATDATSYIWGKNAYIAYINPTPALEGVSAGYTLELTNGYEVSRWYDIDIESTWVRLKRHYEQKITAQAAIYKLLSVVS